MKEKIHGSIEYKYSPEKSFSCPDLYFMVSIDSERKHAVLEALDFYLNTTEDIIKSYPALIKQRKKEGEGSIGLFILEQEFLNSKEEHIALSSLINKILEKPEYSTDNKDMIFLAHLMLIPYFTSTLNRYIHYLKERAAYRGSLCDNCKDNIEILEKVKAKYEKIEDNYSDIIKKFVEDLDHNNRKELLKEILSR